MKKPIIHFGAMFGAAPVTLCSKGTGPTGKMSNNTRRITCKICKAIHKKC